MKQLRTVKFQLSTQGQQPLRELLNETLQVFTKEYNKVIECGFLNNIINNINLHNLFYYNIRESSLLPSQLCISVLNKSIETIKSALAWKKKNPKTKVPTSKLCSIRYDSRSSTFKLKENKVSLLTLNGRITFDLKSRDLSFVEGFKTKSSELIKEGKHYYLCVVFEKEFEDLRIIPTEKVVGIDRGINNLAVSSENKFYKIDSNIKNKIIQTEKLRKELQKKGTVSARKHLQKLSKKVNGYRTEQNHLITKRIVEGMERGSVIVLEDLDGIRSNKKKKTWNKKLNKMLSSWNFKQFEEFLTYKANIKGINIVFVDARFTSQKCSNCKEIDKLSRVGSSYCCTKCNFKLNSDLNASRNIRENWLLRTAQQPGPCVNRPIALESQSKPTA